MECALPGTGKPVSGRRRSEIGATRVSTAADIESDRNPLFEIRPPCGIGGSEATRAVILDFPRRFNRQLGNIQVPALLPAAVAGSPRDPIGNAVRTPATDGFPRFTISGASRRVSQRISLETPFHGSQLATDYPTMGHTSSRGRFPATYDAARPRKRKPIRSVRARLRGNRRERLRRGGGPGGRRIARATINPAAIPPYGQTSARPTLRGPATTHARIIV